MLLPAVCLGQNAVDADSYDLRSVLFDDAVDPLTAVFPSISGPATKHDTSVCTEQYSFLNFCSTSAEISALAQSHGAELSCTEDRTLVNTSKSWSQTLDAKPKTDLTASATCASYPLIPSEPGSSDGTSGPPDLAEPQEVPRPGESSQWSCSVPLESLAFLGCLGSGGSGKVLLAEQSTPSPDEEPQIYAVKVMQKRTLTDFDVRDLRREICLLSAIAQEMESGKSDQDRCIGLDFVQRTFCSMQNTVHVLIVMEYHPVPLSHPDILSRLQLSHQATLPTLSASASLPITFPSSCSVYFSHDEALHALRLLSAELVLGLEFLHSHGIVHQDLKPTNVLVSAAGHAIITDFGSARSLPLLIDADDTCVASSSTAPSMWSLSSMGCDIREDYRPRRYGSVVVLPHESVSYTPQYAAPELLGSYPKFDPEEILEYDERADFWSLGVMLREFATGKSPQVHGVDETWERLSDGDSPNTLGEDATENELTNARDLASFIQDMLAHEPNDRLHGPGVKRHPFLEPFAEIWDEIAALQHPPFPDHALVSVDEDDTTLDLTLDDAEWKPMPETVRRLFDEAAALAEIPWASDLVPGAWAMEDEEGSDYDADCSPECPDGTALPVESEDGHWRADALKVVRPHAPSPYRGEGDVSGERPALPGLAVLPSPVVDDTLSVGLTLSELDPDASTLTNISSLLASLQFDTSTSALHPPQSSDIMRWGDQPLPTVQDYHRAARPLRRRAGVRNLRKAFRGIGAAEHCSSTTSCLNACIPIPQAFTWAFEHQITIALLTTMNHQDSKRVEVKCAGGGEPVVAAPARRRFKSLFRRVKQLVRR